MNSLCYTYGLLHASGTNIHVLACTLGFVDFIQFVIARFFGVWRNLNAATSRHRVWHRWDVSCVVFYAVGQPEDDHQRDLRRIPPPHRPVGGYLLNGCQTDKQVRCAARRYEHNICRFPIDSCAVGIVSSWTLSTRDCCYAIWICLNSKLCRAGYSSWNSYGIAKTRRYIAITGAVPSCRTGLVIDGLTPASSVLVVNVPLLLTVDWWCSLVCYLVKGGDRRR